MQYDKTPKVHLPMPIARYVEQLLRRAAATESERERCTALGEALGVLRPYFATTGPADAEPREKGARHGRG